MKQRRSGITTTLTAIALAVGLAAPAAHAGSLLSGYGGPGEGNQALLGSTLIGGSSGGGGSGGGGAPTAAGSASGSHLAAGAEPGARGAAPGRHGSTHAGSYPAQARGSHRGGAGAAATATGAQPSRGGLSFTPVEARTLGVSQDDLVYILLGLGGLLCAGVLTRRLAR